VHVVVLSLLLGLLALGASTGARAESAAPAGEPALRFVRCRELAQDDVRRIARIELGGSALSGAEVVITCSAERIALAARAGQHEADKTLPVAAVDSSSRPRLVALAVAELVRELERLSVLPPRPPRARPLPPAPQPDVYALRLGPTLVLPLRGGLLGVGATLAGQLALGPWLAVGLSVEASQAQKQISGGTLRWRSAGAGAFVRGSLLLPRATPFAELALLGVLDELAGEARLASRQGASFRAASFATRLALGVELPFAKRGVGALSLGMLRKSRSLRADSEGRPSTSVGPWFASASLSAGVRW
jgi:hypothetical protein